MIHDHTGLNFFQIEDLPLDVYLAYRKDAYIYALNETESGREYLERCWIMDQKSPDRGGLRETFGKGGSLSGQRNKGHYR